MEEAGKENSPNVKVPVRFAVCFQRGGKVRASFLPMAKVLMDRNGPRVPR